MSRDYTIAELRKYIKSIDAVQDDEWPTVDESLSEIAALVGLGKKITVSWIVTLAMATRK